MNLLSYGFDDYNTWRTIPANFHGINIFAAVNAVHEDFSTLIRSHLSNESVKIGERTAYVSLAYCKQKEAICTSESRLACA